MKRQELLDYYGSFKAAAEAIGLTLGAVSNWRDKAIIPELRAREFHDLTGGKLRFRPEMYKNSPASRKHRKSKCK